MHMGAGCFFGMGAWSTVLPPAWGMGDWITVLPGLQVQSFNSSSCMGHGCLEHCLAWLACWFATLPVMRVCLTCFVRLSCDMTVLQLHAAWVLRAPSCLVAGWCTTLPFTLLCQAELRMAEHKLLGKAHLEMSRRTFLRLDQGSRT